MRSSKSRSRGNKNRNNRPTGGNLINRVFDSSGPDGKVRGTPQQIIEKYNQLYRDAQLSNDRVNAENFAQHAEHYLRMLAEAQREVDAKREEQEAQNRERQAERDRERADRDRERAERLKAQEDAGQNDPSDDQPDAQYDLVDTPEQAASEDAPAPDVTAEQADKPVEKKPRRPRQPRKPRAPKVQADAAADSGAASDAAE